MENRESQIYNSGHRDKEEEGGKNISVENLGNKKNIDRNFDNEERSRENFKRKEKEDNELLENIRSEINVEAEEEKDAVVFHGVADEYMEKQKKQGQDKKGVLNKLKSVFSIDRLYELIYSRFPEVAEGNNPESDEYYLKKVDQYNEQKKNEAKELGFDKKIAFLGHIHSFGEDNFKDGSDGSLTVEEILDEYRIAVEQLKESGYDDVYAVITDHNSVNNSIKLAELMEEEGVVKPIVGVESTTKEGYEILSYTTDIEKLKTYNEFVESGLGKIFRNAKSGHSGKELIERLSQDNFVMGIPHPSAKKYINFGGTLGERMDKDEELSAMISEKVTFYEGMNWFQDVQGSNCIAFNMKERMEGLNVVPFANDDFHSKVTGSENTFFNGMYTEIRTDQDISSGEDLLELFRGQKDNQDEKHFVPILKGSPATDAQYKEHLKRATKVNIANVFKSFFGGK